MEYCLALLFSEAALFPAMDLKSPLLAEPTM